MHFRFRRQPRMLLSLAAGAAVAVLLAGCLSASQQDPIQTGSIPNSTQVTASDLTQAEALAAVQKWGTAYSRDGKDKVAALNYAAALRAAGQSGQAVAVMRKAAIYHPDDREVLADFGKALAADGQFDEALATIERAQRADNPDWRLLSTEGGILDSLNRHDEARKLYQQALVLAPGEPQILNNLGLSYVLTHELDKAEQVLRLAASSPKATLKTKENLALVLRLRGKKAEANLVAPPAASATPSQAAMQVPAAENTWAELSKNG
jgi:Flp pilus assembly protein TadD